LKKFRLPLLITVVLSLNVIIYFRAASTIEPLDMVFGECARNSGRTSAALNLAMLFMLGYLGLKTIFQQEKKKNIFRTLMTLFAVNHLVHFFFVSQYLKDHMVELNISENIHGFITFLLVVLFPILLWASKGLNRVLYIGVILHIFNVTYFISDTFLSRVKPEDPAYLHRIGVLIMIGVALYTLYRMFRERSIKLTTNLP